MSNPYSKSDYFISVIIFSLIAVINVEYFYDLYQNSNVTKASGFTFIFVNVVFLMILIIPFLEKRLGLITNDKLVAFMDLPNKDDKLTYPVLSGFLGDQALGSFLGTTLIYTTKIAIDEYGVVLSGVYAAILLIVSIIIMALSFMRFVMHFSKKHWAAYAFASVISFLIMFSFYHLGLTLAP
ncbi:hypothetical protein OLEAN_C07800 [Oleispira antarctica RB-8]|uniref:Uncharacterized protein n=1 Tax=Oleispira antarctica RB-8 TaxID=698738 RepID=R4YKE0_OLEAN|nr:hypothetical protein OLEAN_C07800 [Oleispira antarctica RB-8]